MNRLLDPTKTIDTIDTGGGASARTGKVAALYAQHFRDEVVLTAVNGLENLTTCLSRKIWQKIMIMHMLEDQIEDS